MRKISVAVLGLFFLVASARARAQASSTEALGHFAQVPGAKLYEYICKRAGILLD